MTGRDTLSRRGDGTRSSPRAPSRSPHRSDLRRGEGRGWASWGRPGAALVVMLLALGIWAMTGGGSRHRAAPTRPPGLERSTASTTSQAHRSGDAGAQPGKSSATTPSSAGSPTLSDTGPGSLPQTGVFPSTTSTAFRADMAALWRGIQTNSLAAALPAFFPEEAYVRLKTVFSPKLDYVDRLLAEFQLDIGAAHALLGRGAAGARLLQVDVPSGVAAWIVPGRCLNDIGYFQVSGSRLVYEENGQTRSFGIDSLISWRGEWYVVHLGAYTRSSYTGIVDSPAVGIGTFGPPVGC